MLRLVFICLALLPSIAFGDQALRQFQAETATSSETVIANLARRLPDTVQIADNGSDALVSYSGLATPPALLSFLSATFPTLETATLAPGNPAVIAVTITAIEPGTQISAVINANFAPQALALPLPETAEVLMVTGDVMGCASQTILSHPEALPETSAFYGQLLENEGFAPPEETEKDMSFFIGHAPGCTVLAYFQPDTDADDHTVVVLRFMED